MQEQHVHIIMRTQMLLICMISQFNCERRTDNFLAITIDKCGKYLGHTVHTTMVSRLIITCNYFLYILISIKNSFSPYTLICKNPNVSPTKPLPPSFSTLLYIALHNHVPMD